MLVHRLSAVDVTHPYQLHSALDHLQTFSLLLLISRASWQQAHPGELVPLTGGSFLRDSSSKQADFATTSFISVVWNSWCVDFSQVLG